MTIWLACGVFALYLYHWYPWAYWQQKGEKTMGNSWNTGMLISRKHTKQARQDTSKLWRRWEDKMWNKWRWLWKVMAAVEAYSEMQEGDYELTAPLYMVPYSHYWLRVGKNWLFFEQMKELVLPLPQWYFYIVGELQWPSSNHSVRRDRYWVIIHVILALLTSHYQLDLSS